MNFTTVTLIRSLKNTQSTINAKNFEGMTLFADGYADLSTALMNLARYMDRQDVSRTLLNILSVCLCHDVINFIYDMDTYHVIEAAFEVIVLFNVVTVKEAYIVMAYNN